MECSMEHLAKSDDQMVVVCVMTAGVSLAYPSDLAVENFFFLVVFHLSFILSSLFQPHTRVWGAPA